MQPLVAPRERTRVALGQRCTQVHNRLSKVLEDTNITVAPPIAVL